MRAKTNHMKNHIEKCVDDVVASRIGVALFVGLPTPPEGGQGGIGRKRREAA
jgi:hypothetical protein